MESMQKAKLLSVPAKKKELDNVIFFIEAFLEQNGFDKKSVMQMSIATEEIFTNICSYADIPENSLVKIDAYMESEDRAAIRFHDSGTAFDPLAQKAPDAKLPASKRKEGGLGIYMMKKLVSHVDYRYENGMNILTIIKQKDTEAD